MDKITRAEIAGIFDAALADVKADIFNELLSKPGESRQAELSQLDLFKRLETRINARIECYTKPAGRE